MVTVDEHPFAFVVLASHAYAIGVGIGRHHNIGIQFLGQIERERQGFAILRIGRYYCGEVAVLYHLFGYGVHILESPEFERSGYQYTTGSVKRRVDNAKIFLSANDFRIDTQFVHLAKVEVIHVLTNRLDQCRISLKFHIGKRYFVHFVDDALVVGSQHLCAVIPIGFVTIVLAGVVAGGDIHTRLATEVADGE